MPVDFLIPILYVGAVLLWFAVGLAPVAAVWLIWRWLQRYRG